MRDPGTAPQDRLLAAQAEIEELAKDLLEYSEATTAGKPRLYLFDASGVPHFDRAAMHIRLAGIAADLRDKGRQP